MLHDHGFSTYSFTTMVKYYFTHLKTILDNVPVKKLLLVETETLSTDSVLQSKLNFAQPAANSTSVQLRIANVTERSKHA